MARRLDRTSEGTISVAILDLLDEGGWSAEEAIPGLIMAVWTVAGMDRDMAGLLDEASDLLADGFDYREAPNG